MVEIDQRTRMQTVAVKTLMEAVAAAALFGSLGVVPALAGPAAPQGSVTDTAAAAREKRAREEAAYPVTTLEVPSDVHLEVGGLAIIAGPAGTRILAATRRGEVWAIDGFSGRQAGETEPQFTRVADGLHEPLGLLPEPDGSMVTACRGKLARLVDQDGDFSYETVETISDWWSLSGNYHEYNFGPTKGIDGGYWITTNKPFGAEPFGSVPWRGYALKIMPSGEVKPMCAGLRSPAGVGTSPWGEVFYTDNQGEWCGASKLSLLRPGSYHGHPHGIESTSEPEWSWTAPAPLPQGDLYSAIDASDRNPRFQMPAVWFPYDKMGRSPAQFIWDETGGAFGPFAGQMFVGDQYEAAVFRVDLERVRGHWQGACFRFRDGLASGAVRLAFTPGGALIVGETDRGWGSKGPLTEGIQRIDFSGEVPFETLSMKLLEEGGGFRLRFTAPATMESLGDPSSFSMESYTYEATEKYGSDELGRREPNVAAAKPHEDGLGVDIFVRGLREGYVHELHLDGIRSVEGQGLLHPDAYYTLVRFAK